MLSLGKFSLSHLCVKISASVLKPLSLQVDTCSYLPDDSIRGPQHIVLAKTIHPFMYSISIGEVPSNGSTRTHHQSDWPWIEWIGKELNGLNRHRQKIASAMID